MIVYGRESSYLKESSYYLPYIKTQQKRIPFSIKCEENRTEMYKGKNGKVRQIAFQMFRLYFGFEVVNKWPGLFRNLSVLWELYEMVYKRFDP